MNAYFCGFLRLMYMRVFETIFYQRKVGTMEEKLYQAEEKTLMWALALPGHRNWWASNPISFSDEFREYTTELIIRLESV
jgi:hypothetical protein